MARGRTLPDDGRRRSISLPVAVLLAAIVVDGLLPPEFNTFRLPAAGPVPAAPVCSLADTVATGVAALVVGAVLAYFGGGDLFSAARVVAFTSLVVPTALAALLNRAMPRDRQRLKDAHEVAEAVQRAVLPAPPKRFGLLRAAEEQRVASGPGTRWPGMGVSREVMEQITAKFKVLFPCLDERQRRLLLETEARLPGHGGTRAVARAAGTSETTVREGMDALEANEEPQGRIRRPGHGRRARCHSRP